MFLQRDRVFGQDEPAIRQIDNLVTRQDFDGRALLRDNVTSLPCCLALFPLLKESYPVHKSLLATALLFSAGLPAQVQRNVDLLATFKPNDSFNDVWGYHDPTTGKEYAILMSRAGTYIVDASQPKSPVQRGFFAASLSGWGNSTWRDGRTYRQYLYVVTEAGGGMQIIDLSNPDAPVYLKTWRPAGVNWNDSHNISIDTTIGLACACGTGGGSHFFDLSQDPQNPTYIGSYTSQYVHDLQMQNGTAHLAEISRGNYRLLDISALPNTRSIGSTAVRSCHTAWPTRDDQFAIATSERSGGGITIVDIRTPSAPRTIATWFSGSGTSVHNAFMRDRIGHMSYYVQGYRALDLSDPSNPLEVGYYDTTTLTSTYDGAWGCYPFQPSGIVYASDRRNGLHILRPKCTTETYGTATTHAGGKAPTLHTFGGAWLGNTHFAIETDRSHSLRSGILLFGTTRTNISSAGMTILVDTLTAPGVSLNLTTDSSGRTKTGMPVPTNNSLLGLVLHAQAFVFDGTGPMGISASAGMTFELFAR